MHCESLGSLALEQIGTQDDQVVVHGVSWRTPAVRGRSRGASKAAFYTHAAHTRTAAQWHLSHQDYTCSRHAFYGVDTSGMFCTNIRWARCAAARTVAVIGGGKGNDASLFAADAATGTVDHTFDAHVLPLKILAMAWWQSWQSEAALDAAVRRAQGVVLRDGAPHLAMVTGPIGCRGGQCCPIRGAASACATAPFRHFKLDTCCTGFRGTG